MSEQVTKRTNPLLERLRVPGVTYRLPSQGLFYDDGELDPSVKGGEVEVRPMTAMDEIILSTPDKLLSGKAVTEIFANCIPQVLKPGKLLSKDVDFLLACLREVSFGQFMEVSYRHTCEGAKTHNYMVDMQQMIRNTKVIDPTVINEEYKTTLPNGQVVVLKPLTYSDVVELYQTTALTKTEDITHVEAEALIINTLTGVIRRVDDVSDRNDIREWVISLPLGWKKMIERTAQHATSWGIEFVSEQVCKDCKKTMPVQISANPVSFFT
jgi:hypothetical protein